jgi:hypothetical protein
MGATFLAQQYGLGGDPRVTTRARGEMLKGGSTLMYGKSIFLLISSLEYNNNESRLTRVESTNGDNW